MFDTVQCLTNSEFVFNQRDAHMIVTIFPETDTWAHSHLGVFKKALTELHGTELAIRFGDFGPDIHGCLRALDRPTDFVEPLPENIAALLILQTNLLDTTLIALKRLNGCNLQRRERSVVVVALNTSQSMHQLLVADHVAESPASHVV